MNEKVLYQELAENTVAIDECGGWINFQDQCSPYIVISAFKQRNFSRYLDTIGRPGSIRFDPYAQELELRNRVFHAQLVGSMGNSDWLWSHKNPFLNLTEQCTSVTRVLTENLSHHKFTQYTCVDFPKQDRMLVLHQFAAIFAGLNEVDAFYIANSSQCYAILKGQVEKSEDAITSLNWAIHDLLLSYSVSEVAVLRASSLLSLQAVKNDAGVLITDGKQHLKIEFDKNRWVTELNLEIR